MAARTKIARALVIALRAAWILSTTASAGAETLEEKQACIADAFQFCSGAIPDRDRVFTCLIANKDVISEACHSVITHYVPAHQKSSRKSMQQNKRANNTLNVSSY